MLFTAMMCCPFIIYLGYCPRAITHAMGILNNTPTACGLSPKEIFKGTSSYAQLKNFHTFGSPACILDPVLRSRQNILNYKSRSTPKSFIGSSSNHASNVSLVHDTKTNFIPP